MFHGIAFNEYEDVDEDKESPFQSVIVDIRNKLSKNGDRLIKKGLYYIEEIKRLELAEIKNVKERLIIFKNELIRKNKINNRVQKDLDDYNGNTKYKDIKDLEIYLIKKILTMVLMILNICSMELHSMKNEDKITHKDIKRDAYYAEKFKKNKIKTTYKESPFKSIIEDIKRDFYYVEKMNNISTSDIKRIKEKLVKFKNELFNNNSKIRMNANELNMLGICSMKIRTKKLIFIRLKK